jgi:exopolysaccharide biosynthesis polyprenyl glycosylphosphotransferase
MLMRSHRPFHHPLHSLLFSIDLYYLVMRNQSRLIYSLLLLAGDFVVLVGAFLLAYIFRVKFDPRPLIQQIEAYEYIQLFVTVLPLWLIIFAVLGLYRHDVYRSRFQEAWRLLLGCFLGILFIIGFDFVSDPTSTIFPARLVPVYALGLSFALLLVERIFQRWMQQYLYRFGVGITRIMLVGSSQQSRELAMSLSDTRTSGYDIRAIIGGKTALPDHFRGRHFSELKEGLSQVGQLGIDTIIQTRQYEDESKQFAIMSSVLTHHLDYKWIPDTGEFPIAKTSQELFICYPLISLHQTALFGWGRIAKRIFDTLVSLLGLIILSPFFLAIALTIKMKDPGPIFFRQKRITRYKRTFYAFKFRTMYTTMSGRDPIEVFTELGRDDLVALCRKGTNDFQFPDDPRIYPFGAFMRRFSLDELPQLINVLKGEISLVGPRAIIPGELSLYGDYGNYILSVKSGISGIAQVSGRSELSYEERARLNVYYVQTWSLWLDIKILWKTFWAVLNRKGTR